MSNVSCWSSGLYMTVQQWMFCLWKLGITWQLAVKESDLTTFWRVPAKQKGNLCCYLLIKGSAPCLSMFLYRICRKLTILYLLWKYICTLTHVLCYLPLSIDALNGFLATKQVFTYIASALWKLLWLPIKTERNRGRHWECCRKMYLCRMNK
jgi:hypothetical protein